MLPIRHGSVVRPIKRTCQMGRWTRSSAWSFTPPALARAFAAPAMAILEDSPQLILDLSDPMPNRGKVQVRNRPNLPASDITPGLPEFCAEATAAFPAAYKPGPVTDVEDWDLQDWAEAAKKALDVNLNRHGAMMFRGVPGLETVEDFTIFSRYLKLKLISETSYTKNMQGRSMQSTCVNPIVRTASDEPPAYTIEPHNEFHTADFPTKLLLFCEKAPEEGGEWLLSDGRAIFQQLHPDVVQKFQEKSACYQVFYESRDKPGNRYTNWQTNVAPTKEEVEAYLVKKGYEWKWNEDDSLLYWQNFAPVVKHPLTGELCWYNQVHAHHKTFYTNHPFFVDNPVADGRWPVHCTYGDGTEIEPEVLAHLRQTVWANTVTCAPQPGDVFIVDNYLTLHGRMGFPEGVERKVFVVAAFS